MSDWASPPSPVLLTPPLAPVSHLPSHSKRSASATSSYRFPSSGLAAHSSLTPPDTPSPRTSLESCPFPGVDFARLDLAANARTVKERLLSDNELSYYLPSRQDGVNDMYLHHTLQAPQRLFTPQRVAGLWALMLLRHPLLASTITATSYEDVRFTYSPPATFDEALSMAEDRLCLTEIGTNIIDTYLNGARSLSNDRLAMLVIAFPPNAAAAAGGLPTPPISPDLRMNGTEDVVQTQIEHPTHGSYQVMLCATHFLGDGMALHTFMNDFYTLLHDEAADFAELAQPLLARPQEIPASLEDRLPLGAARLARAARKEEHRRSEGRLIGGQVFPGMKGRERRTIVPTFAYTEAETKAILSKCKAKGVTIAHAVFALCNIAWARRTDDRADPTMIYSALNLRPQMSPVHEAGSFFHLAVGYFNIILPTLLPAESYLGDIFWHRAKETKKQTIKAVKSPFLVSRARETNRIRRERAFKWAAIDDAEEARKKAQKAEVQGLGLGWDIPDRSGAIVKAELVSPQMPKPLPTPEASPKKASASTPAVPSTPAIAATAAPQKALMGLSMLGNLDGMYAHASYPTIRLTSLTTGSRQRSGALLLFAYTFCGKLWLSLGYDVNGFGSGVIEGFWAEVQTLVREIFLA